MAVIVKRLSYGSSSGGGGGDSAGYIVSFNSGFSWTLNGDYYQFTVAKTSHGKTNPQVDVFENISGTFYEVHTNVSLDSGDNITISVSASPDLRFSGKIIIK